MSASEFCAYCTELLDERGYVSHHGEDGIIRDHADPCYGIRMREERDAARQRLVEADRLLRAAYRDSHPEDVPMDVLAWLNPDAEGTK